MMGPDVDGGGVMPLPPGRWPEVYRLMVQQAFPDVPRTFDEAKGYLEKVSVLGLCDNSNLEAVFVVGEPQDGIAFLDVVCAPSAHGKWARKRVLRALYDRVFVQMGLRALWVQVAHKKALKAALMAGFVPATPLDADAPVLVLTRWGARKWQGPMENKEMKDGIAF